MRTINDIITRDMNRIAEWAEASCVSTLRDWCEVLELPQPDLSPYFERNEIRAFNYALKNHGSLADAYLAVLDNWHLTDNLVAGGIVVYKSPIRIGQIVLYDATPPNKQLIGFVNTDCMVYVWQENGLNTVTEGKGECYVHPNLLN